MVWGQEAAGSNPVAPIERKNKMTENEKKYDAICADLLEKIQQSSLVRAELLAQMVVWLNDLENASFTVVPFDQKKDK